MLWNCFDLFIIIVSIVDLITQQVTHDNTHSSLQIDHNQQIQSQFERINHFLKILRVLRVLRSFRALRVLRTIRFIQSLHTIVKTCSKVLLPMASITFIMVILTCISAILARSLFSEICPQKFDNLVKTIFSLFTLLTLDDWYSIYQVCEQQEYSSFQLGFCLIYIFIINFILLNLLMAVLVDNFQHTLDYDTRKNEQLAKEHDVEERIVNNLTRLNLEYGVRKNDLIWEAEMKEIQKLIKEYYMLMESLEIHMERHEQLTKLVQKSIQLTLLDQDNRKMNLKK
ncbi:unnamed protein product [Adineta ricciae]|uniref:Ion transport domain-containing protein n=1 Tax=Adineta ricciae TaxID=249248 RepID=A0A814RWG7_ADIRI|nr:unnamed protein product [Adineta ricciae]CAF1583693.1 unnamed protein product [Adineta ricciae]